ncbi:hypothetical protein OG875_09535 [Streptomyces sp. NBC_01498]|uniref:hypothetical protein n=1 Tax=Streptomyces sp. NBC_01498 TaxID=2975870 RepID=UPI002E7B3F41|nr:hypothetical protein [Streptomyces sp. NBC_01498]WTL24818.1 hypothetical protein OG875_09535 [Streptomyces sp. NBC_01498]
MSQPEDPTALHRRIDELAQRVADLERMVGRLNDAVPAVPARPVPQERADVVTIPDTPYNAALWTDSDDEGLGLQNRRAP